jgi:spore germination protein KB
MQEGNQFVREKISVYQFFAATIMVPLGSAILFLITPEAKQDAWISMLIYMIPGVILGIIYVKLWTKYPEDTITTYMPKIFGKFIGYPISVLYIIFFAYEAARIVRDITELILISVMPKISFFIIAIVIVIISGYATYLGLECMSRMVNVFFYIWIIFFILEWCFLYTTEGVIKLYNLKPVLQSGFVPVITAGWKLITFPYGEVIVMSMFFPCIKEKNKVLKYSVLSIVVMGIILTLNSIMFISVLGVDYAANSLFPFLQTMRLVHIGETFDRVDLFVILTMLTGGIIKISFFMYGSMIGIVKMTKLEDTKHLAIPLSIIIFVTSILIGKNYPEHIYIGQTITLTYIHLPLAVMIPIIALLVYYIKKIIIKLKKG